METTNDQPSLDMEGLIERHLAQAINQAFIHSFNQSIINQSIS